MQGQVQTPVPPPKKTKQTKTKNPELIKKIVNLPFKLPGEQRAQIY
jgi:hypothetical protein